MKFIWTLLTVNLFLFMFLAVASVHVLNQSWIEARDVQRKLPIPIQGNVYVCREKKK